MLKTINDVMWFMGVISTVVKWSLFTFFGGFVNWFQPLGYHFRQTQQHYIIYVVTLTIKD